MSQRGTNHDAGDGLFVRSLERGLAVLRAFDGRPPQLSLSEVAARAGMSPAAARRYLHTFVELGYLAVRGRSFVAQPKLVELAYPYYATAAFTRPVETELEKLAAELHESCALTVRNGHHVTNVLSANAHRELAVQVQLGRSLPAYCTAMGRVLLSALPPEEVRTILEATDRVHHTANTVTDLDELLATVERARNDGYALGDEEFQVGIRSVAVGVRDASGTVAAALSVSAVASRVSTATLVDTLLPKLRDAASSVEVHLATGTDR
ncbi:IclR family transcriptional regulator C-terminal domain-containing protein [Saccharopolyspora oryzae]|uniref:Helix-turn-helix domain-containing protein n=1 Tax=Saccharopolyspora oryzae TaxID=2997343 RepID=A0ABT4UVK8_9PSEU|nr:IclR family transcriptional regulator C-terminal domain-containing protein [Saccharopolyspora oryzae]MDA3625246.1 helix-turn-helix domain-containing protein [Saccharopolyspora oryzae]